MSVFFSKRGPAPLVSVSLTVTGTATGSSSFSVDNYTYAGVDGVYNETMEIGKNQKLQVYVALDDPNGVGDGSNCFVKLNEAIAQTGMGTYTVDLSNCKTVSILFEKHGMITYSYYSCTIITT